MRLISQFRSHRSLRNSELRSRRPCLRLEELELRYLLSVAPVVGTDFHETLDHALALSLPGSGQQLIENGTIGNGPDGAADVTYYQFTLAQPARVQLEAQNAPSVGNTQLGSQPAYVLSLYDTDPFDFVGNRLLAQDDGAAHGGQATLDTTLAAGVYYVAVSGSGNRYFNPYLEGSGYYGDTGDYQISLTATDVSTAPGDGPMVLRTEPDNGAVLSTTPLVMRAALSEPVDPNSLQQDSTVQLYYDQTDPFTNTSGVQLSLGSVSYDDATQEVVITPAAPLTTGYYRLILAGDATLHPQVVQTADDTPIPLGETSTNPNGQDFTTTFQVVGNEGNTGPNPGPDDTVATAHPLGDVTNVGLVQATGVIGDDATDQSVAFNPADVDFYHFQVSGAGNYAFGAEVFADRIDSSLFASMQLYRMDPSGTLDLVASNDGSGNQTAASNFTVPLFSDPVIYASVAAGDYYLAVTGQFNTYDPQTSHSGSGGFTTGPYVLNLRVDPSSAPPHVVATQLTEGEQLTSPPTTFTVQFDEPVNLQPLAFEAYQHTFTSQIPAVFLQTDNGTQYFPRLESFDPTTNQATFLLIDALPNGDYTLHLSGPNGLADFAGNPLVGNDPATGDHLVHFSVNGPQRGTPGNPTLWLSQDATDPQNPQAIGVLFPLELQNEVTIDRELGSDSATQTTAADYYEITILQSQSYGFVLSNPVGLADDTAPTIWLDNVQQGTIPAGAHGVTAALTPGTYLIGVDWSGQSSSNVSYQLNITVLGSPEPATSLTTGPAPALRLRLATDAPPPPSPPVSPPVPPPTTTPTVPSTPTDVDPGTSTPTSPSAPAPTDPTSGSPGTPTTTPTTPSTPAPTDPTSGSPTPVLPTPITATPGTPTTPSTAPSTPAPTQPTSGSITNASFPTIIAPTPVVSDPSLSNTPNGSVTNIGPPSPSVIAAPNSPSQSSPISNAVEGRGTNSVSAPTTSPSNSATLQASVIPLVTVQATASAAPQNLSIPSTVVLALSDRALGATTDPNSAGARAFLRETNNAAPQTATIESVGTLLVSSSLSLSAGVQATAPSEQNPLGGEAGPLSLLPLRTLIVTRAVELPNAFVRAALAEAIEIPAYTESLTKLFDSWQFGYQTPSSPISPSGQVPAVVSGPSAVEVIVEQPTTDTAMPESDGISWYHPGRWSRFAIVALTMTLVALRIHNWRAARSAKPSPKKGISEPRSLGSELNHTVP